MFTCPDKDIHSLYLDGELPEEYVAEYEAHIASCEKCRKELGKVQKLHALFAADSKAISMSKADMDSSFERLQARMSYSKVTQKPLSFERKTHGIFKDIIGAAAAAVIAIILPIRTRTAEPAASVSTAVVQPQQVAATTSDFTPVARMTSFSLPSATASSQGIMTFLGNEEESTSASLQAQNSMAAAVMPFGTAFINPSYTAPAQDTDLSLISYDVFNPIEENVASQNTKRHGFYLHFASPHFSLEIGNDN